MKERIAMPVIFSASAAFSSSCATALDSHQTVRVVVIEDFLLIFIFEPKLTQYHHGALPKNGEAVACIQ